MCRFMCAVVIQSLSSWLYFDSCNVFHSCGDVANLSYYVWVFVCVSNSLIDLEFHWCISFTFGRELNKINKVTTSQRHYTHLQYQQVVERCSIYILPYLFKYRPCIYEWSNPLLYQNRNPMFSSKPDLTKANRHICKIL